MARHVDRAHLLEAEVPLRVGVEERPHEAAARPVDVQRHVEALLVAQADQQVVDPDDVVGVPGERRPEHRGDADRVLVDVRLHVLGPDRVLVGLQRDDPRLDVEVAAELLPHHVHVAAEHEVRPVGRPCPPVSRRSRHFHFSDSAPSMIASEEPWVRAPVVSPGAWNRFASMRMQRCSISAVCGYSAWSMKLRWRFSAMIRCASGSIHVVTNVARLRIGMPSRTRSSSISRIASTERIPCSGRALSGADSSRKRLPYWVARSSSSSSRAGRSAPFVGVGGISGC